MFHATLDSRRESVTEEVARDFGKMRFSRLPNWPWQGRRTIAGTLAAMVLGFILPAWLGVAFLIVTMYAAERERAVQNTIVTADALVRSVDREIAALQTALKVLATAPELTDRDFAAFHARARHLTRQLSASNIVLIDHTGQQLLNTLTPYGTPLPRRPDVATLRQVLGARQPSVSNLLRGPLTQLPLIRIEVPVIRDGQALYALATGLFPDELGQILTKQPLPPGWIAALFDGAGNVVARTQNADRFVAKPGAPAVLEAMAQRASGFVTTNTLEGIPVEVAFSRSPSSGWTVAIGVPEAELVRPLYLSLEVSGGGALCLLAVGLALARMQAKRITSEVEALTPPAQAIGRGEPPVIPSLRIREIDDVAQALGRAFQIIENRTHERDHAAFEKEVAEKTARLKDEFIVTVSHELRTPLTAITASLGLLAHDAEARWEPAAEQLVGIAYKNCQRLGRLVDDILDVDRLEGGKVVFDFREVDPRSLLEQVVASSRALADEAEVSLALTCAAQATVHADPDRLTQVFSNLMSNAIKFSPPGGEVIVLLDRDGANARVSFRDHGPGVPPEFQPRLFERFAQSADGAEKGGAGLGLSIAREIVQRLGGKIGFVDAPGGGAIFHVLLPVVESAAATASDVGDGARTGRERPAPVNSAAI
jgi:signal transduction histidine kinase